MTTLPPAGPQTPWRGYDRSTPSGPPHPGQHPAPTGPQPLPYAPPPAPPPGKRRSRWPLVLGIAAGAVLLAGMVAGLIAMVQFLTADFAELDEPTESATVTGRLLGHTPGAGVSGPNLARAVNPVLESNFEGLDELTCPATPRVDQNVTTVCHGTLDDEKWTVVVFFEDQAGNFTVLTVL